MKYFFTIFMLFNLLSAQSVNKDMLIVLKNDGKIAAYDFNTLQNEWAHIIK